MALALGLVFLKYVYQPVSGAGFTWDSLYLANSTSYEAPHYVSLYWNEY
jgi:hypothetical protein